MDLVGMIFNNMMASSSKTSDKDNTPKAVLYKQDAMDFMKWGLVGFVGLGVYTLGMKVAKRNIDPSVELHDRADSFNLDPVIRDSFINIQPYRKLNTWLFKMSVYNTDHLLFLENALLTKTALPTHNDKVLAFSYFRMALSRLNQFQILVRETLGNEHAMAVNMFVEKIYGQLQKHLLNVLHICSEFKPANLIARAQQEVEQAMQAFEDGKKYNSSSNQWNKFARKTERSQLSR